MIYFFLSILVIIILFGVFMTFFWGGKKKQLSASRKEYYTKEIQKVRGLPSASERIMKYDNILHHILKEYGYQGTLGDQLKAKPLIIDNLDTIWDLHKLRNRLAHDMETISA
ncbi:MAG: hypothetical protein Q8K26_03880, partial [Candidatus Gracilibacteria bacterium]|nr:hypothetical protein [Candidatus Gracilibacteria bacterium]